MKKLIAFDLDGTLALSKQALADEMADLPGQLTQAAMVGILSGGDWRQFVEQAIRRLPARAILANFLVHPTTGTKLYRYQDGGWTEVYAELVSPDESQKIRNSLKSAVEQA